MKKIYCLKCGAERYDSVEVCPVCGSRESTDSLDEYLARSGGEVYEREQKEDLMAKLLGQLQKMLDRD